ncbi:MAG: phosphoglucosamine mutase [Spirochaetales bacterium]|nr:phosphoglucosamine mutase [Spirochaetales bacterium]
MGNTFGVSGLRGKANESLTADIVYRFARYLGNRMAGLGTDCKDRPSVVIGKDTRISSDMFEAALSSGLAASGCDVYLLGVCTTPSVSYITKTCSFSCGVMVTASHNPYYDNGIKVISSNGEPMGDGIFAQSRPYVEGTEPDLPYADTSSIGRIIDYPQGREKYIKHLISIPSNSIKGIRIGLDCANGSSYAIAHEVFGALGADVTFINDSPDGLNINSGCGSEHLEAIRALVKEKSLDVGFSLDGDADRCMAVDRNGSEVNGDNFSFIYAKYLKDKGKLPNNLVVGTVISNLGLRNALLANGIDYIETTVGEPTVRKCMLDHGAIIGGEQCGHMVFSQDSTTGDGILTALRMLDIMADKNVGLYVLASPLVRVPQEYIFVRITDKKAVMADSDVNAVIENIREKLGQEGRLIVRSSDTENLIRIMVEASTQELCRSYADQIIDIIRRKGY